MKKQLIINTLSFEVHTEVYDGYGDMEMVARCFTIDRKSCVLTMTDFQTEDGEQSVMLEGGQMTKLLRYIVHTLIFSWTIWRAYWKISPKRAGGQPVMVCAGGVYKSQEAGYFWL